MLRTYKIFFSLRLCYDMILKVGRFDYFFLLTSTLSFIITGTIKALKLCWVFSFNLSQHVDVSQLKFFC